MPTPSGLPYPDPDDPVALGAADIRALAEALDLRPTIIDVRLAAPAASIDLPAIPQTFRALQLITSLRDTYTGAADPVLLRINNVSTASYHRQQVSAAGAVAPASFQALSETAFLSLIAISAGHPLPNSFASAVLDFPGYREAAAHKAFTFRQGYHDGVNIASSYGTGYFHVAAAITRITLTPANGNFVAGSRATLIGL